MNIPTLATARLTLRTIIKEDLDVYAVIWADPVFAEHIGGPVDRHGVWHTMAANIGCWALEGVGLWSVVENATGQLVGRAGLWNEPGWPGVEAAWFLGRQWWGRGYATEAGAASIGYAFEHLDVDEVVSVIRAANTPSICVAERLGMSLARTQHLHGAEKNVYAISRAEWEAHSRTGC